MREISKYTYFQYFKEMNLPVYIRFDLAAFDGLLFSFLTKMRFSEMKESDAEEKVMSMLKKDSRARLLTMEIASLAVSRTIDSVVESDRFGNESIVPKDGYRVYRHKDVALMIYSFGASEWRLGVYADFGNKEGRVAYRTVINRYLSWALAPNGFVGFWGVPVEEGIVVMKARESEGEVVFVDILGRRFISQDGASTMHSRFKILRLDSALKGRNVRMGTEELFSFLTVHTSYFDYQGPSTAVRQMLQALSRMTEGLIHPRESFKPRTDLSL
jgi:hypothetical protein